jgi:hypothetical protein
MVWGERPGEGGRTVWGEGKIVCGVSGTKEPISGKLKSTYDDGGDPPHDEGREVQVTSLLYGSPKAPLWSQSSSVCRGHES